MLTDLRTLEQIRARLAELDSLLASLRREAGELEESVAGGGDLAGPVPPPVAAVELIAERPGITAAELAREVHLDDLATRRLLAALLIDGTLARARRGYHAVGRARSAAGPAGSPHLGHK